MNVKNRPICPNCFLKSDLIKMFYVKRTEILYCKDVVYAFLLSLPARGAWIEIDNLKTSLSTYFVAPRKESVD